MLCLSIHKELSSESSNKNDSIETEFVHVESEESSRKTDSTNNEKKKQQGEHNQISQEYSKDNIELINNNKYVKITYNSEIKLQTKTNQ